MMLKPIAMPCCLGCLLLVSIGSLCAGSERSAQPLNFVFILVDDLGYSDLGCYGSDLHETPHIDRFAAGCLKFSDAYAAAPVCTPTRAALMTGKYPARLHMTIWYEGSANPPQNRKLIPPVTVGNLPHQAVTIAELLHDAGYLTAHVGKWHLGDAAHYPETQGFDINIGGTFWGAPDTYFYPYRGRNTYRGEGDRYVPHTEWGKPGEYLTDRLTQEALGVLDRAKDRPFFLYMAYHTVHVPIEGKPEIVDKYAAKVRPGMRHRNPDYAAMVHSLDENVGRLLARLDQLGVADRTVVFLTSDNGGFVNAFQGEVVTNNAPLRSGKGSLYEGGIRVPLLIRWPGATPPGATCREPVSTIDLYPTILEMAAVEGRAAISDRIDGLNLVPLVRDHQAKLDRPALYWHFPHYYPTTSPVSSIRKGDWKLLEYHEDSRLELYDLRHDLGEQTDLAAQMPARTGQLSRELRDWLKAVGAQMARPNPIAKPTRF